MIKFYISLLLFLSISAIAAEAPKEKKADFPPMTSKYCMVFDAKQGFVRCESPEIICYSMGKTYAQCYPKPPKPPEMSKDVAPKQSPAPAPTKK